MRLLPPLVVLALSCNATPEPEPEPAEVRVALEPVASDLSNPVYVTSPPGDSARLFLVEQPGAIRIHREGQVLAAPFLDLSSLVRSTGTEQGLLGLAFHPKYPENGRFFVNYTRRPDGATVVAEYQVSDDPDRADPEPRRTVLTVAQPYANHNAGDLAFGPDGFLYVGLGDGGAGGDPHENGQDRSTLLGTMLRLDVDGEPPYAIPPDNPFAGREGMRGEIWAWGLRNPWRYSFDRQTGDLYIADVGQNEWEEVHVQPAASDGGENYGWNTYEGTHCFDAPCEPEGLVMPVVEYPHPDGCSITGGYVYRGEAIEGLAGHYLYGDYCTNWVRSFRWSGGAATDERAWTAMLDPDGSRIAGLSSFGQDAAGELYLVSRDNGTVYKLVPAP